MYSVVIIMHLLYMYLMILMHHPSSMYSVDHVLIIIMIIMIHIILIVTITNDA